MRFNSKWCVFIAISALATCARPQPGPASAAGSKEPSSTAGGAAASGPGTPGGAPSGSQGLPPPAPTGGGGEGGGGAILPAANLCDIARASNLLVEGNITGVGNSETAAQAGLAPIDTMALRFSPASLVWPVTLQVTKVEYAGRDAGSPPTTLTFWYMGHSGPTGPNNDPMASGMFFLTRYDGQWVSVACFAWDSSTAEFWSGDPSLSTNEFSEAGLVDQAEAARGSAENCWQPVCPNAGGTMLDSGWCIYPDAGPAPYWDGGNQP